MGIRLVSLPAQNAAAAFKARASDLRQLLRTIPGKENYYDDGDVYVVAGEPIPGEGPLRYSKPPIVVLAVDRAQKVIGYMYAVEARATYSSEWLAPFTQGEIMRIPEFSENPAMQQGAFYVGHWAVHSDMQGKGVGFMLTRELLREAKMRGIPYLTGASHPALVGQLTQGTDSVLGAELRRDNGDVRVPFLVRC